METNQSGAAACGQYPASGCSISSWFLKYRIVKDDYAGYEAQVWRIWFPFWIQIGGILDVNTSSTVEGAEKICRMHKDGRPEVVKYV